jgi:hypothetical protein
MKLKSLRSKMLKASGLGAVAVTATLALGTGVSGAITLPSPATSPLYQTGTVQTDRGSGSDTTFFMMQKISDLYNQAGLYGCTLDADQETCNQSGDVSTTDTVDNYDRTEEVQGVDDVGSGAGQGQLCGTIAAPIPVDYARSSKPVNTTTCPNGVGMGYAKDGVPAVDFQGIIPGDIGTSTAFASVNGGLIGPVAAGWLPGDPVDGPYSGTPFSNLLNNNGTGSGALASTAYRLYCQTGGQSAGQITDWGQLTNLSASGPGNGGVAQTVGNGAPIGIPINIIGVNSASGTESTFSSFVGCSTTNTNAQGGSTHQALENNVAQINDFAVAAYPSSQVDQAVYAASSLYYMANGVYNTNPYQKTVTLNNGNAYPATRMKLNGVSATAATELNNTFPTARTLYNVYNTTTVRASTAAFLNWICDSNSAFTKGKDLTTGLNYDAELTTLISTTYGFPRLTDTTAAPNNSCQLITSVSTTPYAPSGSTSGPLPSNVVVGSGVTPSPANS